MDCTCEQLCKLSHFTPLLTCAIHHSRNQTVKPDCAGACGVSTCSTWPTAGYKWWILHLQLQAWLLVFVSTQCAGCSAHLLPRTSMSPRYQHGVWSGKMLHHSRPAQWPDLLQPVPALYWARGWVGYCPGYASAAVSSDWADLWTGLHTHIHSSKQLCELVQFGQLVTVISLQQSTLPTCLLLLVGIT